MAGEAAGAITVPPTLRALLAARLDQLDPVERRVLERAAVEGEIFHRGAVQTLTPEEPHVTARLAALVRRALVQPERALIPGEVGFRFRHLLIRDAAYDGLPKATRAELHQRFAGWLEEHSAALVELDELAGYHLEQAARYKDELGQPDADLAERGGERLAAAGRRALGRGDERAAVSLLERALELARPTRLDVHLELDLADALRITAPARAAAVAGAAAERARATGDEAREALARVAAAYHRSRAAGSDADELERLARSALPLLEQADDHAGLVHVWFALGYGVANVRCRFEDRARAAEQALHHSRLVGRRHPSGLFDLDLALASWPRPADEALTTLDTLAPADPSPLVRLRRAWLLAMLGRFEEAWPIARAASERLRELTDEPYEHALAEIAILAGDHETAARYLRTSCDRFRERGARGILSSYAPLLGRELCALDRYEEAEPLARLGRELGAPDDVLTQMLWRQVQALVHASRGEHPRAEGFAREAVALAEQTDALNRQGDTLSDLAEVLHAAGRTEEAAEALEQALERYERKHNRAMVAQVKPRLEALQTVPSS